jgi:GTPase KRas protein
VEQGLAKMIFVLRYVLPPIKLNESCHRLTLSQFLRSHYGDEYDPTAEDSYQKTCMVDDELARLDILDTAGQEYYRSITEQYMQTGDGFLLVFSVTSLESLKEVVSFMHQIQQAKGKAYFPIVVVGNHCTRESKREVSYREGRSLAESFGYAYIEADATNGVNVQQAFFEIVREIRRYDKFKTWMAQQSLAKGRGFEATRDTTQLHTGIVRRADERTFWRRARRGPSMEMINEDS